MTSSAASRYRELTADLVTAERRHSAAVAAAHQSYADGFDLVEHDISAAREAVELASNQAAHTHRVVANTDLAASALWDELRRVRGRRGRRLGPVPPAGDESSAEPGDLLDAAAARIERARRGGEPLPLMVLPVLFALGFALSAVVAAVGSLVGWPLLLLAPFAGVLPARFWVDRRFASTLDPGAISVLVLGGILAMAAILMTR